MKEYLVTIEYRFNGEPDSFGSHYRSKIDTIGIFKDIKNAVIAGNGVLKQIEERFGLYGSKSRLAENNKLISNLGYIETPFTFYLKITTLEYNNVANTIDSILNKISKGL